MLSEHYVRRVLVNPKLTNFLRVLHCLILFMVYYVYGASDHRQSKEWTGNAGLKRYDANANSVIRAST